MSGALDGLAVRVEGEHEVSVGGDRNGQAAVAAAELEHLLAAEGGEPAEGREVLALGVEDAAHAATQACA